MQNTIVLGDDPDQHAVQIVYTKDANMLSIMAWYDCGIQITGTLIPLAEFFRALGIDRDACNEALRRIQTTQEPPLYGTMGRGEVDTFVDRARKEALTQETP